jgi:hypothetical protein
MKAPDTISDPLFIWLTGLQEKLVRHGCSFSMMHLMSRTLIELANAENWVDSLIDPKAIGGALPPPEWLGRNVERGTIFTRRRSETKRKARP